MDVVSSLFGAGEEANAAPEEGDLVWVRDSGSPWWPGRVTWNDAKQCVERKGRYWVKFFNEGGEGWCKASDMIPFRKAEIRSILEEVKDDPDYEQIKKASMEAYQELKEGREGSGAGRKSGPRSNRRAEGRETKTMTAHPRKVPYETTSPTSVQDLDDSLDTQVEEDLATFALDQDEDSEGSPSKTERFTDQDEVRLMKVTQTMARKKRELEHQLSQIVEDLHSKLSKLEDRRGMLQKDGEILSSQAEVLSRMLLERGDVVISNQKEALQERIQSLSESIDLLIKDLYSEDLDRLAQDEWRAKEQAVQLTDNLRSEYRHSIAPLKKEYKELRFRFQDFADFDPSDAPPSKTGSSSRGYKVKHT
uniref:PWWP domain-containing protein n=1 Tax=Compsopogon caeruleus TaxID=31354 RepID=A0A7S1XCI4_9RHOD|mmetsp:Transcript_12960/g.26288  ORF Transcript_12960/g.26288 Transcript_12960/m.26288 type:complete len:363 (+) Transcript_12960:22-1110(+)